MPRWGVKIISPNNIDEDLINVEVENLSSRMLSFKITNVSRSFSCWKVTFNSRLEKPELISGSKLHRKVIIDEVLSKVESVNEMPNLMAEINQAITPELKDVIKVEALNPKRNPGDYDNLYHMFKLEIDYGELQTSYIQIDDIGFVMDGGDRYVIDVPAFADSLKT